MKYINIFLVIVFSGLLVSCDPYDTMDDPEIETTPVGEMLAGEWWVTYTVDGEDIHDWGYTKITTSNTSANTDSELYITDHDNFWSWSGKLNCSFKSNTFSGQDVPNDSYDITFNIANGKVIPGGGITKDGTVTDSIYMEVEYSDGGGTVYVASGVRRTGFLEDEY